MRTLICGSIAFDSIMVFQGRFKDHILPDRVHMLSVSFLVPELRREFGGTAGNIAYSLKQLGGDPLPMGTVGDDAGPYLERFDALGIDRTQVRQIAGTYTAQAFITTDLDDNQIAAFHPGAMSHSHASPIPSGEAIGLAIIAPDGRDGMLRHARELAERGIPFVFDPGQGLPMFDGKELSWFIERAAYVAVNDYESQLLVERTGVPLEDLARRVRALIVTRGAQGSTLFEGEKRHDVPAVAARATVDPTGCGDAYRAGLLYGLGSGMDLLASGRLASVLGALKIEQAGPQNHRADRATVAERYEAAFGHRPF